jgi:nitronate monooxygenase
MEAGGHRGSFINSGNPPLIGLMSLLPQLSDNITKPIIAAGGIADGRGIKAAITLGAQGVQIGSSFIASNESAAIDAYKAAMLNSKETDTVLTRSITGRWARGLKNKLIERIEKSGLQVVEYPIQNTLTASLRNSAVKQNNKDFISLWAGQSSSKALEKSAAEIFQVLVKQAEELE